MRASCLRAPPLRQHKVSTQKQVRPRQRLQKAVLCNRIAAAFAEDAPEVVVGKPLVGLLLARVAAPETGIAQAEPVLPVAPVSVGSVLVLAEPVVESVGEPASELVV